MIIGSWLDCLLDYDRAGEFTNDDVDQFSKLVDLGRPYEKLLILVPDLKDSGAILNIYVQEQASSATVPKLLHRRKLSDDSTLAWATTSGEKYAIVCDCLGGFQYIRIRALTAQTANATFRVCGVRS